MFRFVGKFMLFVLLQAGIYYACYSASQTQKSIPEIPVADQDRLTPFVREKTLPLWTVEPDVIAAALATPPRNELVDVLARGYNNGPDNYMCAGRDKNQRLQSLSGERLILAGGSSLAFGMDSAMLEERYGMKTVNMGLLAALGVRYMTRQVAENVRQGDVVILSIESFTMCHEIECDPARRAEFCAHCPELAPYFELDPNGSPDRRLMARLKEVKYYADRLALSEFSNHAESVAIGLITTETAKVAQSDGGAQVPDEAAVYKQASMSEFDRQIPSLIAAVNKRLAELDQLYVRSEFNAFGDLTGHWHWESPKPEQIPQIERETSNHTLGPAEEERLRQNVAVVNACAERCHAAGATVYFAAAPLNRTDVTTKFAEKYEAILKETLEVPLLFPIESCFVDQNELFDTCTHLNGRGIRHRMQVWTTALDEELTPQVSMSPADHVAARRRELRKTVVAKNPVTTASAVH